MAVPGIEGYLDMRPLRLAEAVMSGFQAGAAMKRQREATAEREQARADRLAEQQSRLLQEFGPDAVIEPESGAVDINRSALARQKRLESEAIAEAIGEEEAISGFSRADVDQSIRQNPGYLRGQARGASRRAQEEAMIRRWTEVEQERTKGAREREEIRRETELEKAILDDMFKEPKAEKGDEATVKETIDGKEVTYKVPKSELGRLRPSEPAAEDPYDKALREIQEAEKQGRDFDLEIENGVPVIRGNLMFPTAPADARARVEALRRRSGAAPRTNAIPITDLLKR